MQILYTLLTIKFKTYKTALKEAKSIIINFIILKYQAILKKKLAKKI